MTPGEKVNKNNSKNTVNTSNNKAITENNDNSVQKKSNKIKQVLKFKNVTKKFVSKQVINNCDITLNKGEVMAIIAPEGHGKSTIAKMAAGIIYPSSGEVLVRGIKAGRITNSIVSYQPDIPFFKYDTTISELLNMYSRFFKDFSYKRAYKLLKHFDISKKTKFENLSTTALFIIQVIFISCRKASLYIFDDPLIHCDPKYREDVILMIDKCRKYGGILLLSQTANGLDDITDKVVFLKKGSIVKEFYDADSFEKEYGNALLNDVYKEVFKRA